MPHKNRLNRAAVLSCCAIALLASLAAGREAAAEISDQVVLLPGDDGLPADVIPTPPAPLPEFTRTHAVLGFEFGMYGFRTDDYKTWLEEPMYLGLRYSLELGLNTAVSVSGGLLTAETEVSGGQELQFFPVRAQFEVGSTLANTLSRWYVGAGIGYNFTEDLPNDDNINNWPAELPNISNEFIAQATLGFDFKNETLISTRIEGGHVWYMDSIADMWMGSVTVSYQF